MAAACARKLSLLAGIVLVNSIASSAAPSPSTLACDRELRKTMEAIQAWRRLHHGQYPGRLADLKAAGLLARDSAICPDVLSEAAQASASHGWATSRISGGDPSGTYEYELSSKVMKSGFEKLWLPDDSPPYTRQDVKVEILRRPFFEQIPILRCSSHRRSTPPEVPAGESPVRNITVTGGIYWSGSHWEHRWLADVPYCCRDANVLFGLKGPPFHTDNPPDLPQALDLRPWACAFGDHPWWWTFPLFDEPPNRQKAPTLRPFFEEKPGRVVRAGDHDWWIDGLAQLQGRTTSNYELRYQQPGLLAFVWERTGLPVNRTFRTASWLQGTVWTAPANDIAGWLQWHYADGSTERVPIVYGKTTARFWADREQLNAERHFPSPVWSCSEKAADVGKDRSLRLYQQSWSNLRPETSVTAVDFISNRDSPAAPFLIAVNLLP